MRVLRDKLWAKLTALVLFVLLGFLALLRTAQLFSNYMPGHGRALLALVDRLLGSAPVRDCAVRRELFRPL